MAPPAPAARRLPSQVAEVPAREKCDTWLRGVLWKYLNELYAIFSQAYPAIPEGLPAEELTVNDYPFDYVQFQLNKILPTLPKLPTGARSKAAPEYNINEDTFADAFMTVIAELHNDSVSGATSVSIGELVIMLLVIVRQENSRTLLLGAVRVVVTELSDEVWESFLGHIVSMEQGIDHLLIPLVCGANANAARVMESIEYLTSCAYSEHWRHALFVPKISIRIPWLATRPIDREPSDDPEALWPTKGTPYWLLLFMNQIKMVKSWNNVSFIPAIMKMPHLDQIGQSLLALQLFPGAKEYITRHAATIQNQFPPEQAFEVTGDTLSSLSDNPEDGDDIMEEVEYPADGDNLAPSGSDEPAVTAAPVVWLPTSPGDWISSEALVVCKLLGIGTDALKGSAWKAGVTKHARQAFDEAGLSEFIHTSFPFAMSEDPEQRPNPILVRLSNLVKANQLLGALVIETYITKWLEKTCHESPDPTAVCLTAF